MNSALLQLRTTIMFVTVVLLAISAAGCGPNATNNVQLQSSGQTLGYQSEQTTQTPPPTSNTTQVIPAKEPMKTLQDFEPIEGSEVTLRTNKGDITFTLFRDKAPLTTLNFLTLVKQGFYDGLLFHRVIPDFMAQVGDPLTRDPSKQALWGTGGTDYVIADEFSPDLKHDSEGIVSMANRGANTGGSQIFITYGPTPWLDGKHAVFGKVTSGMDVLRQLQNGDQIVSATYR